MASDTETPVDTTAPAPSNGVTDLAAALSQALSAQNPKKVTIGRYDPRSNFQPDKKKTIKLRRPLYQNGVLLDPSRMFNAEIALANKITKSGRYIDRMVEVIVRDEAGEDAIELRWPCKTPDQRFALARKAADLTTVLQLIVTAQEAEVVAEGARVEQRKIDNAIATAIAPAEVLTVAPPAKQKRAFGETKAMRAAREAADLAAGAV